MAAAERRKEQMEQQNKLLHEQLEKLASQLPTGGKCCHKGLPPPNFDAANFASSGRKMRGESGRVL